MGPSQCKNDLKGERERRKEYDLFFLFPLFSALTFGFMKSTLDSQFTQIYISLFPFLFSFFFFSVRQVAVAAASSSLPRVVSTGRGPPDKPLCSSKINLLGKKGGEGREEEERWVKACLQGTRETTSRLH